MTPAWKLKDCETCGAKVGELCVSKRHGRVRFFLDEPHVLRTREPTPTHVLLPVEPTAEIMKLLWLLKNGARMTLDDAWRQIVAQAKVNK